MFWGVLGIFLRMVFEEIVVGTWGDVCWKDLFDYFVGICKGNVSLV